MNLRICQKALSALSASVTHYLPMANFAETTRHLSGWFVLNVQSFEDAWVQVLHGGYSECSLELWIGPVDDTGLWDGKKNPHLTINTLTFSFSRPAPALRPLAGPSRAAFDLKGQKTISAPISIGSGSSTGTPIIPISMSLYVARTKTGVTL